MPLHRIFHHGSRLLSALVVAGCSSRGPTTVPVEPAPTVLRCERPLPVVCSACSPDAYLVSQGCPPQLATQLPNAWCATNPGAGAITGSCAGYTVLGDFLGSDQYTLFLYPSDGGALAAIVAAGNLTVTDCLAGTPDFELPLSCFGDQGLHLLSAFDGPGALPGCSTFDASANPVVTDDAGPDDAGPDGGDGGCDAT
jgi:hypothetical protein